MMNGKIRMTAVAVLAVLALAEAASAYYSPAIGRFLSRDPLNEQGAALLRTNRLPTRFVPRDPARDNAENNLYRFVDNTPGMHVDPQGTDIYLKTGNNSGRWLNDTFHQNVCVDTWQNGRRGELVCFSFGANTDTWWYLILSPRRSTFSWLGWKLSDLTPSCVMDGEIYESDNTGEWTSVKGTTPEQDQKWLDWMRDKRKGTKDAYTVSWFNCRNYSQREYNDAPGNH